MKSPQSSTPKPKVMNLGVACSESYTELARHSSLMLRNLSILQHRTEMGEF